MCDEEATEAYREQAEAKARFFEGMDKAAKASAADRTFFQAAKSARLNIETDGLEPVWVDYEWRYSAEQGAKAACHAREDVIAITYVQHAVLKRLDRNRNYMWAIIALLIYLAFQMK